jgi:3-hydroxyacyl-CoA dehydrogenase
MGGGIAMASPMAACPVDVLDTSQEALDRGMATISRNYAATVAKGRLAQDTMDKRIALIKPTLAYDDLADADLVIEAVFERMDVKKEVFARLDAAMPASAILASNTSTLNVDEIAASTKRSVARAGAALLQPGERDAAPGGGARQGHREAGHGHRDATRQAHPQGGGRLRRLRRLHRQSHARGVRAPVAVPARGGRPALADRRRAAGLGHGNGPVPHVRHGGQRHRLRSAQAPPRRKAPGRDIPGHRRPWSSWAATARRRAPAGIATSQASATRSPIPRSKRLIVEASDAVGITRRADLERGDRRAVHLRPGERRRADSSKRASPSARATSTSSTSPATASRLYRGGPMFYADTVGLAQVLERIREFEQGRHGQYWKPAALLERLATEGKRFNGK